MPGGADTCLVAQSDPTVYNVEMDVHKDLDVGGNFIWAMEPALKTIMQYEATLRDHPNPTPPT
jgi:hypothetical protein